MICSNRKLRSGLDNIRSVMHKNGYPNNSAITRNLQNFKAAKFGPSKCSVYFLLPWLGIVSRRFEKLRRLSVRRCYFAVEPRVVFTTRQLLPAAKKDVLPAFQHSNIIYQYLCYCDSRYVCRTSQSLSDRIKQHVPISIRTCQFSQDRSTLSRSCKSSYYSVSHDSAFCKHLLDNQLCALHYNNDRFFILFTGRSCFHLSALKATFIITLQPNLCRQKEFLYNLKIFD